MPETEWCETLNIKVEKTSEKAPKRVRCPKCKRNIRTFSRVVEGGKCVVYMSKHKKKKSKSQKQKLRGKK